MSEARMHVHYTRFIYYFWYVVFYNAQPRTMCVTTQKGTIFSLKNMHHLVQIFFGSRICSVSYLRGKLCNLERINELSLNSTFSNVNFWRYSCLSLKYFRFKRHFFCLLTGAHKKKKTGKTHFFFSMAQVGRQNDLYLKEITSIYSQKNITKK